MAESYDHQQQQLQSKQDEYLLKWEDYNNHMSIVVSQLFKENSMVDVTLVVDGEKIQVHRIVLCSWSTLFQELLSDAKDDNPTITICGISACDVRHFIDWCYSGKVPDDFKNFQETALLFQINYEYGLDEDIVSDNTLLSTKEIPDDSQEVLNEFITSDNELLDEAFDIQDEINDTKLNIDDYNNVINDNQQQLEQQDEYENEEEEKQQNINIINEIQLNNNNDDNNKKKKRRKEHTKREYNEEMLELALKDLKNGKSLVEASTKNGIPRSTLYMRAKIMKIQLHASRNEYSQECMNNAISEVLKGSSLQNASEKFGIPKTVLWRRIQKDGYHIIRSDIKKPYCSEKRIAAIKALERGENLTKVSLEFQIPKTTLFRDKAKLVDEGKLPSSFWKKRKTKSNEELQKKKLEEAVAACKNGKLSQAAAALKYGIPKTTIWRRLQQYNNNNNNNNNNNSNNNKKKIINQQKIDNNENNDDTQNNDEIIIINESINDNNNDYSLCGTSSDISIAYIHESNLADIPQDAIILEQVGTIDNDVHNINTVHEEEFTSIVSLEDESSAES